MDELEKLTWYQQGAGTILAIAVSLEIVIPVYALHWFLESASKQADPSIWPLPRIFVVVCISGFLGGSVRFLYRLTTNLKAKDKDPGERLSRWFLYLFKPFLGLAGGLAFFIATNLGILAGLSYTNTGFNPLGVILISFVGGMFFDDVFRKLLSMVHDEESAAGPGDSTTQSQPGQ